MSRVSIAELKAAGIEVGDRIEVTETRVYTREGRVIESPWSRGMASIETANSGTYGISSDDTIELIEPALPDLVNGELYVGTAKGGGTETIFRWSADRFYSIVGTDGTSRGQMPYRLDEVPRYRRVKLQVVDA